MNKNINKTETKQLDGYVVWNAHNTVFGSKRAYQHATKYSTAYGMKTNHSTPSGKGKQ